MWLVKINDLELKTAPQPGNRVSFCIEKGRQYALTGPSGSGKTSLLQFIAGRGFRSGHLQTAEGIRIAMVGQQHRFKNLSYTSTFYYQQRFQSADAEDSQTVEEELAEGFGLYRQGKKDRYAENLLHLLQVQPLLKRRLIQLSNGEHKRVQLVKWLLVKPDVLLLDNAFAGLDQQGRGQLQELLQTIAEQGVTLVLVTAPHFIPSFCTHVLQLDAQGSLQEVERACFLPAPALPSGVFNNGLLQALMTREKDAAFAYAVRMNNVNVCYGTKRVLRHINWAVKKGERWAVRGPNGAGKSTLLSLINGDNPLAYANEIYLFDKRRGTGESIWDIKRHTGYVSPELHLYFEASASVFETVASGLFDTVGLFRTLSEDQAKKVMGWMELLHIKDLRQQLLRSLPAGTQRLVLLARALVKNPPLLLLDEPVQGLDEAQAALFKQVVEQICAHSSTTLVYISHYKDDIPCCVDRVLELSEGQVV